MPKPRTFVVITSVHPPTAIAEHAGRLRDEGTRTVVVADVRTPAGWSHPGVELLSVEDQRRRFGALADAIPYGHYSRKNLGYLYAMQEGAEAILETDDDSVAYEGFGRGLVREVRGRWLHGPGWVNVYHHFTPVRPIWPRGLPLPAIHDSGTTAPMEASVPCPVQQFLIDEDPDVDAIHRLTHPSPTFFEAAEAVVLGAGARSPFNTQNTAIWAEAFPLSYLPCHVGFRVTDIWRSLVMQEVLERHGLGVAFLAPTVRQVRNPHDLMADFREEIDGYLRTGEIADVLRAVPAVATEHLAETSRRLWEALARHGIVPPREMEVLDAFLHAVARHRP